MSATLVIGFVIEKIRNVVSAVIGAPEARSLVPHTSDSATRPPRVTTTWKPVMRPVST